VSLTPVQAFERGALVRWTSQARGTARQHVGVVVLKIPGGVPIGPLLAGLAGRYNLRPMHRAQGNRPDTSYLVAIVGQRGGGKARLHWPHASLLRPYNTPAPA
jgi:hypothetical protein